MWGTTIAKNPVLWTLEQQEGRSPQKPGRLPPSMAPAAVLGAGVSCLELVLARRVEPRAPPQLPTSPRLPPARPRKF